MRASLLLPLLVLLGAVTNGCSIEAVESSEQHSGESQGDTNQPNPAPVVGSGGTILDPGSGGDPGMQFGEDTPPVAAGGAVASPPTLCEPSVTEANKTTVSTAIDTLLVRGDASVIDTYWADPYLQHNPIAASGVDTFKSVFSELVSPGNGIYQRVRTIGECDLVLIHGSYDFTGPMFDMFRLENGKLVEHWDAGPPSDGPNSSGHSALDGPTEFGGAEFTEPNKELILDFTHEVLISENLSLVDQYMANDLIEHDPESSDGRYSFVDNRSQREITTTTVHHVIADGNVVFTMTEGALAGTPHGFYDLYRLDSGFIVEHWNGRREVPDSTASGLPIF